MDTHTVALTAVPQQVVDEIQERPRSRCRAVLSGTHLAEGVVWDGVVLEAETWEAGEALQAALLDLGIRVSVPRERSVP